MTAHPDRPTTVFETPTGRIVHGDATDWLKTLADESVDLVVADPPYNIDKAAWDSFGSAEAYVSWCQSWLSEAARVLTRTGTAYIFGFSEILADLRRPASQYFSG